MFIHCAHVVHKFSCFSQCGLVLHDEYHPTRSANHTCTPSPAHRKYRIKEPWQVTRRLQAFGLCMRCFEWLVVLEFVLVHENLTAWPDQSHHPSVFGLCLCRQSDMAQASYDEEMPLLAEHRQQDPQVGVEKGAPLWKGIATLGASCGGVGILSMPICMHYAGWVLGTIITIAVGVLADASLCMIVTCCRLTGESTFPGIGQKCYGSRGHTAVLVTLLATLLGCAICVLLVVCQLSQIIARDVLKMNADTFLLSTLFVSAVVVLLTFPLTLLRSLSRLAPSSAAAVLALAYVSLLLIGSWCVQEIAAAGVASWALTVNTLAVPSIVIQAFICHFNILPIYAELRPSSKASVGTLIHSTIMGFVTPAYCLFGIAGYMQLGTTTENCANVLLCFSSPLIRAGTVAVALTNFLKYPLLVLPFRDTVNTLFTKDLVPFPNLVAEMACFSVFAYGAIYYLGDVGKTCNLIGCTAGTAIMLVLPGLFYAKAHAMHVPDSSRQQAFGHAMAVIGLVVSAMGIYNSIVTW